MMNCFRSNFVWLPVIVFLVMASTAFAQRKPHIGYIYPAGGQQGTTVEVSIGGQYLNGVSEVYISGTGVDAKVVEHKKPIPRKKINDLRNKLRELQKLRQAKKISTEKMVEQFNAFAKKLGLKEMDIKTLNELRKKANDPKRQLNTQLSEQVIVRVTLSKEARPGMRQVFLKTSGGITNVQNFIVGQYKQVNETEPNNHVMAEQANLDLPVIINGQIMPGDVDCFKFKARRGMNLVVSTDARRIIPYLADAVPGWFQATLTLMDDQGNEVAFDDDYLFHPDPVIRYKIPKAGDYVLKINDAIYRGREDFVYRITLGEVPFVTSVFPLGARVDTKTAIKINGWNLSNKIRTLDTKDKTPGLYPLIVRQGNVKSNPMLLDLGTLPECLEKEPNHPMRQAQSIKLPMIVNGHIDQPGDWDIFKFHGQSGDQIVAQVQARRLGSPLDSILKLTDANGKQIASNDDFVDKGTGLVTHQADSELSATLPTDGTYYLHLGDTQNQGGPSFAYRLRLSQPQPDFDLRIAPAGINANGGMVIPITVYALRQDGFAGDISLKLKDAPSGFTLNGGWIPADKDKIQLTMTVPSLPSKQPFYLQLEGCAVINEKEVCRSATPAEDQMQAFLYRHLVPMKQWVVSVTGRKRYGQPLKLIGEQSVKLQGPTAIVRIAAPKGPFLQNVELELSSPPKGITIGKVSTDKQGLVIRLNIDQTKVEPGLKDNLIIQAFMNRTYKNKDGKVIKRRNALGALPAIPFEVVGNRAVTSSNK